MKFLIRIALTVVSLATIPPVANAATLFTQHSGYHQGSYDNTGHGPQETGLEGGGN